MRHCVSFVPAACRVLSASMGDVGLVLCPASRHTGTTVRRLQVCQATWRARVLLRGGSSHRAMALRLWICKRKQKSKSFR